MIVLDHSTYQFFQCLGSLPYSVGCILRPLNEERPYEAADEAADNANGAARQHGKDVAHDWGYSPRGARRVKLPSPIASTPFNPVSRRHQGFARSAASASRR